MSIFQNKRVDIHETQHEVIEELLGQKRKSGEIRSDSEFQAEKERILQQLSRAKPLFKARTSTSADLEMDENKLILSDDHNAAFQNIHTDIHTVFSQIKKIDEVIHRHKRLDQSILNQLKLRVHKVGNELHKYERLADYRSTEFLHLETFMNVNSLETTHDMYRERDNTLLPFEYQVQVNVAEEGITLPPVMNRNAVIGPAGTRMGSISVRNQLGRDMIRIANPENDIDKALDTSDETTWSETILSDMPIRVELGDVKHGAAIELDIHLDYLTEINQVTLTPFSEYPMDLVNLHYFSSDDEAELPTPLVSSEMIAKGLKPRVIDGPITVFFDNVKAKRLRLTLNQRHYIKTDFIASTRNQENLEMWFESRRIRKAEERKERTSIVSERLDEEQRKSWHRLRNAFGNIRTEIDDLLGRIKWDHRQAVRKYEYQYGLYGMEIRQKEYQRTGIYVSKPIPIQSNVRSVQLETAEVHPEVLNDLQLTDIEYYISEGAKWYPIVPGHIKTITSELIRPKLTDGKYVAELRFPAQSKDIIVRRNGLDNTEDVTIDANQKTLMIANYNVSDVYTVEYKPIESAREVDFLEIYTTPNGIVPNRATEEFKGTNHQGQITLNNHPFVDKERLNSQPTDYNPSHLINESKAGGYLPFRVRLIDYDGYHIDQPVDENDHIGVRVENKTDYFQTGYSYLQSYDEESNIYYEYEVKDNTIQFNRPVPQSTRVIVEYPYLVHNIRLKAILRRNIHSFYGITPQLNEYIARFKTLN